MTIHILSDRRLSISSSPLAARAATPAQRVRSIRTLCLENSFDPVCEYLDGLKWDGTPRLRQWLTTYLGAEASELNSAIGTNMLVAAVRRVRKPGTKFDTIVVLEGDQGSGKSSAIAILAGREYFSDQDILALDARAQMEALEGVWMYEISELAGMRMGDVEKIKAFASRWEDRARPAYGRFRENRPRRCIFVGTTNAKEYLRDQTGNRRFWPVATTTIDLAALEQDRDQLWAEAAMLEAKGESIVLAPELWPAAAEAQAARVEEDPWVDVLANITGELTNGTYRVATEAVWAKLGIPADRQFATTRTRVIEVMRGLGWTSKVVKIDKRSMRGFERPQPPPIQGVLPLGR